MIQKLLILNQKQLKKIGIADSETVIETVFESGAIEEKLSTDTSLDNIKTVSESVINEEKLVNEVPTVSEEIDSSSAESTEDIIHSRSEITSGRFDMGTTMLSMFLYIFGKKLSDYSSEPESTLTKETCVIDNAASESSTDVDIIPSDSRIGCENDRSDERVSTDFCAPSQCNLSDCEASMDDDFADCVVYKRASDFELKVSDKYATGEISDSKSSSITGGIIEHIATLELSSCKQKDHVVGNTDLAPNNETPFYDIVTDSEVFADSTATNKVFNGKLTAEISTADSSISENSTIYSTSIEACLYSGDSLVTNSESIATAHSDSSCPAEKTDVELSFEVISATESISNESITPPSLELSIESLHFDNDLSDASELSEKSALIAKSIEMVANTSLIGNYSNYADHLYSETQDLFNVICYFVFMTCIIILIELIDLNCKSH